MMSVSGIPVWKEYGYRPAIGSRAGETETVPILIVGAGPIGLAMALDLGRRGRRVVVLNALPFIPRGSKAICFSKRSLEIYDRLGVGDRLLEKGVVWEKGKVFWRGDPAPVYEFDLLPVKHQKFPAFINIQQYYVEEYLLDAIAPLSNVEVRWRHELVGIAPRAGGAKAEIETPEGRYFIEADFVIACDGSKSTVRRLLGLDFEGRVFEDNFLIADVKFDQERPTERWFQFEPPYPGYSSLIHKQPDGVWRLDFQLGRDIDKKEAIKPENVEPFVRGFLGDDIEFEFEWLSVYTFQCRRMRRFVHGRIIFAGDSAHLVSPFGARGCNGGMQDIDNLGWKLDRVLSGLSPESLLESYNDEATFVADENILNSTRSTNFMTPRTRMEKIFRDSVLELSRDFAFARPFVNSGRLSVAVPYSNSPLNTPDTDVFSAGPKAGATAIDAPLISDRGKTWLLSRLGDRFIALYFADDDAGAASLQADLGDDIQVVQIAQSGPAAKSRLVDAEGLARSRFGAQDGACYLVRPDQHVAGRWLKADSAKIRRAHERACASQGGAQ